MHNLASLQYLGELVAGRRVLVVGPSAAAAEHARELGARKVAIVASPAEAEAFDRSNLEIHAAQLDRMSLRAGSFDLALVLDLPSLEDPAAVLSETMRVVGLKGHVVVALRNPTCEASLSQCAAAPLDYYEAYDMLAGLFPSVQMVGQSPFIGYAVADLSFDGADLPVAFDGSLLGDSAEEVEWFLAVCGQVPAALEPYTVVQVPFAELSIAGGSVDVAVLEKELKAAKLELGTRGVKIESLQKDLERELMVSEAARAKGVELSKQLDDERKAKQRAEIEGAYSRRSQIIEKPQDQESFSRQRQAEDRAKVAENARDELVMRLRSDAAELERLRRAQEEHEAKSRRVASKIEELSTRAATAEKELAQLREAAKVATKREEPVRNEQVALLRQAEGRARSAEASRDALLEQMRADAAELDRLRQRYDELRERTKRADQEHGQAAQVTDALRAKAGELEVAATTAAQALTETQTKAQTAEQALAAAQAKTQSVEQALAAAQTKAQTAEQALAAAQIKAQTAEQALAAAQAKAQTAEQALAAAQAKTQSMEQALAAVQAKAKAHAVQPVAPVLMATVAPQTDDSDLAAARAEVTALEKRLTKVAAERTIAQQEIERHRALVRDIAVELQRARAAVPSPQVGPELSNDDLEQELARLRGALSGQHRARVEAELAAATLEVERDRVQVELLAKESELAALRRHTGDKQAHHTVIAERDRRIADLESELQSCKWRVAELEARSAELTRQASTKNETAAPQVDGLQAERDMAIAHCRGLERDLEQARAELAQLTQALSAAQRNHNRLDQELDSHRDREQRLSEHQEERQQRIADLEQEVARAAEQRRVLENELARLHENAIAVQHQEASAAWARSNRDSESMLKERITRLEAELSSMNEQQSLNTNTQAFAQAELRSAVLTELQVEQRVVEQQAQARVAELETVVSELRTRLAQQNEWSHDAGADAARLSGDLNELAAHAEALERELRDRLASEAAAERALELLREDLVNSWRRSGATAGSNSAAQENTAERTAWLEANLRQEKERAGTAMRELTQTVGNCAELSRQLAEVRDERDALSARVVEAQTERLALHHRVEQCQTRLSDAEEKLAAAARARSATSEQLADALADLDAAGRVRDQTASSEELPSLRLELDQLSSQLATASAAADEKEALVSSLSEQLEEREQRAARLEKEVQQLLESAKEHESDIAAWEMELKFRNARIAQLETEIGRLQGGDQVRE